MRSTTICEEEIGTYQIYRDGVPDWWAFEYEDKAIEYAESFARYFNEHILVVKMETGEVVYECGA